MEILKKPVLNQIGYLNRNLSLALGFFDGVHLAHREILTTAVNFAKKNGLKSAVITFEKSPGAIINPSDENKSRTLQTLEDRLFLMETLGLDFAFVLNFEDFKHLSAKEYLENVLIKNFSPKYIVTGFNHTFGARCPDYEQGNSEFLRAHQNLGYKYIEIEKMRLNNTLVSSTNIKKFIEKAYIKEANALLGYDFNIEGTVVSGMGLARKLGFKTANLNWPKNIVKPPYGVYFGAVEYRGEKYRCLLNWGVKPTVNRTVSINAEGDLGQNPMTPVLEAHILDFNQDIYGENIRVFFKLPLREEKKFSNIEELKFQIADDIKKCMDYNY